VRDRPIDILGDGGYVVAPPSKGAKGDYQIIDGSLDGLDNLPVMEGLDGSFYAPTAAKAAPDKVSPDRIREGNRNDTLWGYCMSQARQCGTLDDLLDVAQARNDEFLPPLEDEEVIKVARSAWGYEERGENCFGGPCSIMSAASLDEMIEETDTDLIVLIVWLKANNKPDAEFWVADGLRERFKWSLPRFRKTRRRAVETGWLVQLRKPAPKCPALYKWGPSRFKRR
jgi:Primase C terminal 1 (PriCT-1)